MAFLQPSIGRKAQLFFWGWVLIQALFFLPPQAHNYSIQSFCGTVRIIQRGRDADLWGACSDRFRSFARLELVPLLRRNGVTRLRKIVLLGHYPSQTAALAELQKNFKVDGVYYPPDKADRMRQTFQQIQPGVQIRRIKPGRVPD